MSNADHLKMLHHQVPQHVSVADGRQLQVLIQVTLDRIIQPANDDWNA